MSIKAGRYYVSTLVEIPNNKIANNSNEGIGIDLGIKDLAVVSNGKTYKNINRSARLKKLEKQSYSRTEKIFLEGMKNLKKMEKVSNSKKQIYKTEA